MSVFCLNDFFVPSGIGVDDLFVIHGSLNSLSHHDHQKPVNEVTGRMLKHAGVSILVTSVTDVMAFGIGATTVSNYCGLLFALLLKNLEQFSTTVKFQ